MDSEEQVDIPDYEISFVESLHDFKNVINRVLNELPNATQNKELQGKLSDIVNSLKGGTI